MTSVNIPLLPRSYIDDFAVLAISEFLPDNCWVLSKGLDRVVSLLGSVGMTIDPDKLDLIHFSRRPGNTIGAYFVICTVGDRRVVTEPKRVMHWLGMFFDSKLTFTEHVKIMCNRARSIINGLRCLSNTVRGLAQPHLRILYKTCVVPVMSYASAVWYRSDKRQTTLVNTLEVTQNRALRPFSVDTTLIIRTSWFILLVCITTFCIPQRYGCHHLLLCRLPSCIFQLTSMLSPSSSLTHLLRGHPISMTTHHFLGHP